MEQKDLKAIIEQVLAEMNISGDTAAAAAPAVEAVQPPPSRMAASPTSPKLISAPSILSRTPSMARNMQS